MPTPDVKSSPLSGTWDSPPDGGYSDGELGPTRTTMELTESGIIQLTVLVRDSLGGDGEIKTSGVYRVEGDTLISDVIDKGHPAKLSVSGQELTITLQDGEKFTFRRREKERARQEPAAR